jgi:uncharacterized protein (TIGR02266 family)
MAQDTRKDPRAKVLTMTVRYKSATLDEFIEHHSYDISRGGMFIKTPSPFPPGTLLKFEVKIAEDRKLMQGVGRVVWKREASDAGHDRPGGMGVKFIKVDEDSKKLIDQLVAARGEGKPSAFDVGQKSSAGASSRPAAAANAEPERAAGGRKATVLGLGSAVPRPTGHASTPAPAESEPPAGEGTFFPKSDGADDQPPPEDRTVMKQAAELLQDALREAGGSMDEVGEAKPSSAPRSQPPELPPESARERGDEEPEPKSARAALAGAPGSERRGEARMPRDADKREAPAAVPPVVSAPASARRTSSPASSAIAQQAEEGGGGGKLVALVIAAAAAVVLVWLATRQEPASTTQQMPEPPVQDEPPPPEPTAAAEPEMAVQDDPEVLDQVPGDAAATEEAAAAPPEMEKPVPEPEPVPKKAVAPAPRAPKPVPRKPKPPKPEEVDLEEAPESEAEPAPEPPPAPKPSPVPEIDNPY